MRKLQVIVPFFIAGLGTCFAGIILDNVQYWEVYTKIGELFILLPALLGLKGNLQMTLASRFSTHFHMGHIQTRADLLNLTCANLSLNQFLSIVVSLGGSFLAVVIHLTSEGSPINFKHILLITATALLTSSVTSFLLDIFMIMVVQISTLYNINPDNVATPVAASLGDMTALGVFSFLASSFYQVRDSSSFYWLTSIVIIFYIIIVPSWASITHENVHTSRLLSQPSLWYPLITAMVISSFSGVILKTAVPRSQDIALFQPVICGVGGNLVAVQASRLSTLLHRNQQIGESLEDSICMNPCNMFISDSPGFTITRLLMAIVVPGQIVFYFFCIAVNSQTTVISVPFLIMYVIASEIQVVILLYLAHVLTYALWSYKIDPDNCTIPCLTSVSDVFGTCLVTIICVITVPSTK